MFEILAYLNKNYVFLPKKGHFRNIPVLDRINDRTILWKPYSDTTETKQDGSGLKSQNTISSQIILEGQI